MTPRSWPSPARSSTACMSTTGGPCCSAANPPDQETPMRRPSLRRHQAPGPAHEPASAERDGDRPEPQRLGAVLRYFLRLGTSGSGGPIAVVGYMQRDLVEQRGWIAKDDFLNGVALGQTMPGPLAAQVAMWVGYLRRGTLGALAVAAAFIAPSFFLVFTVAAAPPVAPATRPPLARSPRPPRSAPRNTPGSSCPPQAEPSWRSGCSSPRPGRSSLAVAWRSCRSFVKVWSSSITG